MRLNGGCTGRLVALLTDGMLARDWFSPDTSMDVARSGRVPSNCDEMAEAQAEQHPVQALRSFQRRVQALAQERGCVDEVRGGTWCRPARPPGSRQLPMARALCLGWWTHAHTCACVRPCNIGP